MSSKTKNKNDRREKLDKRKVRSQLAVAHRELAGIRRQHDSAVESLSQALVVVSGVQRDVEAIRKAHTGQEKTVGGKPKVMCPICKVKAPCQTFNSCDTIVQFITSVMSDSPGVQVRDTEANKTEELVAAT